MELKEFLETCTLDDFIIWFKDRCLEDSFNNINDNEFKIIVINKLSNDEEYSYHSIEANNIDQVFDLFKNYYIFKDQQENEDTCNDEFDLFELNKDTLFFINNDNQLLKSKSPELKALLDFLTDIDTEQAEDFYCSKYVLEIFKEVDSILGLKYSLMDSIKIQDTINSDIVKIEFIDDIHIYTIMNIISTLTSDIVYKKILEEFNDNNYEALNNICIIQKDSTSIEDIVEFNDITDDAEFTVNLSSEFGDDVYDLYCKYFKDKIFTKSNFKEYIKTIINNDKRVYKKFPNSLFYIHLK